MAYSRRTFLSTALSVPAVIVSLRVVTVAAADTISIASPDGKVRFGLFHEQSKLRYRVALNRNAVITTSQMGIIVDGVDLGGDVAFGKVAQYRIREKYPSRFVHSEAINNCNGLRLALTHGPTKTDYTVEVRVFNDGVSFRYIVPGTGSRVPDESTAFTIPAGSTVWFHDFEGHYEGVHARKALAEIKDGDWAAMPVTFKLPNNQGYASITEAALVNYAGMGLQADGRGGFRTRLGHALPVSYPFRLRYKDDVERLAKPAAIEGTITTPWRVVMIGANLNTLVNCDIIENVSPPPDKDIFPRGLNTEWIRPGRCVWKYLDGGENTLAEMKEFSRLAGELGFEYNLVEGFWQRWPEAQLRELVDYSKQQQVGIWLWKHSRDLRTPDDRRKFFKICNHTGVVGAKIDFFDHEAKEIIDLYQVLLKESAQARILVEFHGSNKPAGESRTWPNEMTRESIRGLEYRRMTIRARHNTTLPFTRMLAGHADYSVMHFGDRRRETSWAHQIASAVIISAPVLIFGAHPRNILVNPAVDLIKSIPTVWDQSIVLPLSEIGEIAAFARRQGRTWFLAIMNGLTGRTVRIPLSFLGRGRRSALLVRDRLADPAAVRPENSTVTKADLLTIEMRAGGGFVGRFSL